MNTHVRSNPSGARFSVAPMMAWTPSAQRCFMRKITRHALLYTEMVTTGALLHGDSERFLAYHADEHPLALQLGGSEPDAMARCAKLAENAGYDEVNINVGCPSDRVQNGAFGACMMAEPERIADCVAGMRARVALPVTVKTRIGIDCQDSYAFLHDFAAQVAAAGADRLIVHARKAWLSGLSPKENREKPPLDYARVHRLAADFPALPLSINGGIVALDTAAAQLEHVDGVMLGRQAYRHPYTLIDVDRRFFGDDSARPSRIEVAESMRDYIGEHLAAGGRLKDVVRHMLGLFHAQPGGRAWRRVLSEQSNPASAGLEVLDAALACVTPREEAIPA